MAAPQLTPHNRWDLLEVADIGDIGDPAATPRVSVVLPFYQRISEHRQILERTLAGLATQTYPTEAFEVIVVDDGSDQPLNIDAGHLGLDVTALHQQRDGFGAPRARNLGARQASGEVLLFLDADMIPEATWIEAHVRWHVASDVAVTLGPRWHVDASGIDPSTIASSRAPMIDGTSVQTASQPNLDSVPSGLAAVFADLHATRPAWIDEHLARTNQLTSAHHDLFRVVASGNLGVSKRLFDAVGGFDEGFDQWGGEDTELGYRLFVAGGLLIHDEAAVCWHQGDGDEPDASERISLVEQRPKMGQSIAHHGFRRIRRGRTYQVPRVVVTVRAREVDAGAALSSVESVLASSVTDLMVLVDAPVDPQQRRWLQRQFEFDARVVFDPSLVPWMVPYRMRLDAPAVVGMETVDQVLEVLTDPHNPIGVVFATAPPAPPSQHRFVAWSARAMNRVAGDAAPVDALASNADGEDALGGDALGEDALIDKIAATFGRTWLSGTDIAVGEAATVNPLSAEAAAATAVAVRGELQALGEVLARLEPAQQQQLVATAKAGLTQLSPRQMRMLLSVGQRGMRLLARLRRRR